MRIRQLVESAAFNNGVVVVIVLNAVLIGLSTYFTDDVTLSVVAALETICVAVFVVEIALRFQARDSAAAFFRNGWNVFDLVIVIAALIPASSGVGPILRILRVFRVLRLVKTIPELRLIVDVLLRSVASMKYVALLAAILFYVYAVIGVKLFGGAGHPMQPYFSSIHEACFTLFRILTGDDWTQMRYELAQTGQPLLAFTAFQVTWIIVATFLLVNLIVGAVINNYQKVQEIEQHRLLAPDTSERRLRELVRELDAILSARER
ncbi:MAG: ion transporter [Phycisphaerae bacterium]|nr:ion transporter [Phycisphaerae bacterium]